MPLRRFFAVGLWLLVTASATAIVWAGTSTVAADLTDRPPPVVDRGDVVTALESGSPEAKTAPGITTPANDGSPSAGPSGGPGSAPGAPNPQAPGPGRAQTAPPGARA